MNVFYDNPALPKKRGYLMLTNLINHYDDIKGRNLEHMLKHVEVNNKFDYLENVAKQGLYKKISYYLNLVNPKEWLLLTSFAIVYTMIIAVVDTIIQKGFAWRYSLLDFDVNLNTYYSDKSTFSQIINVLNVFDLNNYTIYFGIFLYVTSALVLGLIATSMGYFISPNSDGSGIPELKVVLSGINMYQFYDFNSLIGKTIGITCGIIGGISVGRAGPYIHIAGIIGIQMLNINYFESIKSSFNGKSMLLVCSAAAGITLSLGAPLGGVIFAIEQSSSVFLVNNLWKCFYVAMICIFTRNIVKDVTNLSINHLESGFTKHINFKFEAVYFVILGIISGFVASLVTIVMGKVAYTRRQSKNKYYNNRFYYAGIVSIICAISCIIISPLRSGNVKFFNILWRPNHIGVALLSKNKSLAMKYINSTIEDSFSPIEEELLEDNYFDETKSLNYTEELKYLSDYGLINNTSHVNKTINNSRNSRSQINNTFKLNNISHNNNVKFVIKQTDPFLKLLHPNETLFLIICFVVKFLLVIISNTANWPLGVIGELLVLGTMFGRLYGHFLYLLFGIKDEYIFSLVGASCFLSCSAHSIAASLIMYELTGESSYVIHLLFASLISNLIGQFLSVNVFDLILFIRNLPHLNTVKSEKFNSLTAKDVKDKISYYLVSDEDVNIDENNNIIKNQYNVNINNTENTTEIDTNNNDDNNKKTDKMISDRVIHDENFERHSINRQGIINKVLNKNLNKNNIHDKYLEFKAKKLSNNQENIIIKDLNNDLTDNQKLNSSIDCAEYVDCNKFNIISALILLYRLPKNYYLNIPVIDKQKYIKFTITAKKLFSCIVQEYFKNKHTLDIKLQSNLNEYLEFLKNKFYTKKHYFMYDLYRKIKKLFPDINEDHKYRLDKHFLQESMYRILNKLKSYSVNNCECFLNNNIDTKNKTLEADESFLTIDERYSVLKVQFLFTFLSMSHLLVTNRGQLCGIIIKEEFINKSMNIK